MANVIASVARRALTSPSMGEVSSHSRASGWTEGVCALALTKKPPEAHPQTQRASPPQSSLRDDSSPIEGERGLNLFDHREGPRLV